MIFVAELVGVGVPPGHIAAGGDAGAARRRRPLVAVVLRVVAPPAAGAEGVWPLPRSLLAADFSRV